MSKQVLDSPLFNKPLIANRSSSSYPPGLKLESSVRVSSKILWIFCNPHILFGILESQHPL